MDRANEHLTPASSTSILAKDQEGKPKKENWNYRSIIGMLNFLVNLTHPELAHAVHQCVRFCEDPKASHESAVKSVVRYLLFTREK
eukprot:1296892-Ditylum_brightwellii.AAC.1